MTGLRTDRRSSGISWRPAAVAAAFAAPLPNAPAHAAGFDALAAGPASVAAVVVAVPIAILSLLIGYLLRDRSRKRDAIAALRAEESERRRIEANLATAQQIASLGSWSWHIPTGDLWWSDEIYRLFGLTPQQFGATYEAFLNAVHPDDRDAVQDAVNTSLESRRPYSIEHRVVWPDGTVRWVHEQGEALYENDTPVSMNGTVHDVTRRKEDERKIRELNETLERRVAERTREAEEARRRAEHYLDIAGTIILVLDDRGDIVLVNRKGGEILGYDTDGLIGRNWFDTAIPEDIRSDMQSVFRRIWKGELEPMRNHENEIVTRFGKRRTVRWHNAFIRDTEGNVAGILSSGEDVTDERAAEEELRRAKDDAVRANKAKSEFLSSMSHELRTPLNAILGFGQLLETDAKHPLSDKQREATNIILRSGNHLLDLINEVLDLSRVESGRLSLSLERVDPGDVFEECLNLTRSLADKRGITVTGSVCTPDDPIVTADYTRLKQVLLNLISNAIKYNRDNGEISVTCGAGEPGYLRIEISDTGPGIPPELHDELFKPFSRLGRENSAVEGTGIGLSLTKRLIELMNGTIGFSTTVGEGSTFWFDLPLASRRPEKPAPSDEPRPRHTLRAVAPDDRLVLYVEDNPANLKLMENIFDRLDGTTMISAHTAELGLELAAVHHPDLIILDINLPGMDGFQALGRLRGAPETRDTPVIALSALAMEKDVRKALRAGFSEYLTKPVQVADVTAAVGRVLGQAVEPDAAEKPKSGAENQSASRSRT